MYYISHYFLSIYISIYIWLFWQDKSDTELEWSTDSNIMPNFAA